MTQQFVLAQDFAEAFPAQAQKDLHPSKMQ